MKNSCSSLNQSFDLWRGFLQRMPLWQSQVLEASLNTGKGAAIFWNGAFKYTTEFMDPSWNALSAFCDSERRKLPSAPFAQTMTGYANLMDFNVDLGSKALISPLTLHDYFLRQLNEAYQAMLNTLFDQGGEDIAQFTARKAQLLDVVVNAYPKAIEEIKSEYGFHFDEGGYVKAGETDRFELYQVLPRDPKVKVKEHGKPIIIVPPYVLGANILAFLPGENKSYVHCFANQGIPTYIRIMKDIESTEAVQLMTPEDDTLDTRLFCTRVMARHGRPVTLNGFCQGGYMTTLAILSGELDGLVDAHITCVAPIDGSRSLALVDFMKHTPERFRDLGYSIKTLPNGIPVVDGKILSWVFKLKSIDKEAPIFTFFRDLMMFDQPGQVAKVNKTAAAINHWMLYDKSDLPLAITRASYDSYTIPVAKDGTLPVKLFNRALNFKRFREKNIPWLICIAEKDDLVDEASSLAPLDWVDAEVTVFPKGHTAMATSWSMPTTECSLDACFSYGAQSSSTRPDGQCRGPVRYQLELDETLSKEG
jgi:hypothetical protein